MTELQMLAVGYAFFMTLIGVELAVSRAREDGYYTLGEMVVNIGHGVVYQVFDHLTKGLVLVPFGLVSGMVTWSLLPTDQAWGWLLGFLLYDLANYWAHRHHHEIHALWAIHGVHHAAEDYNLAAALRQPAFQGLTTWLWRLPLALALPFRMFVVLVVVDFLYQFLQHTRYVGKLGPLEWVMNTPSHHRVHHGSDAKYLDKNYGGMLIIWDRLFGTFQEEEEEPTFGVTKPLNTLNPVWGNLAIFAELGQATALARGWNKLRLWWAGPADLQGLCPVHTYRTPEEPNPQALALWRRSYVVLSAMVVPPCLAWMLLSADGWSAPVQWGMSGWLVWSVVAAGALLEGRRWWGLEGPRWAGGLALVAAALAA